MTKSLNNIFKPKSKDEILRAFCKHYHINYEHATKKLLKPSLLKMLRICGEEKRRYLSENNFEKAANCRDNERRLLMLHHIYL